jgi:hypothetical protein
MTIAAERKKSDSTIINILQDFAKARRLQSSKLLEPDVGRRSLVIASGKMQKKRLT